MAKTPQVAALPGMTPLSYAGARADAKARLVESIARLDACKLDDMVLAWTYGLGVKLNGNVPAAVSLDHATAIDGSPPVVTNGAGERAVLVRRQDAIRDSIAQIRRTIAMLESAP